MVTLPRGRRAPSHLRSSLAPRLAPIALPELAEGLHSDLEPSGELDGLLFEEQHAENLDLSGASIRECRLLGFEASTANWRNATVSDTIIERFNIPTFSAIRGAWRDVSVEGSRLGSAEMYEARWQGVQFSQCKLGYVNLRGAHLRDVVFTDCTIDELDVSSANLSRVSFVGCKVGRLDVQQATLAHVDLRGLDFREIAGINSLTGALIDSTQLALLAPLLAAHIGVLVSDERPPAVGRK